MSISHKVLVDVDTSKEVNEEFHFRDPAGNIVQEKVDYEWLHVRCSKCQLWGHSDNQWTKKTVPVQCWVPMVTESKALPSEVKQLDILQIKIAKQLDEKGDASVGPVSQMEKTKDEWVVVKKKGSLKNKSSAAHVSDGVAIQHEESNTALVMKVEVNGVGKPTNVGVT